jgi:hypothetical protein
MTDNLKSNYINFEEGRATSDYSIPIFYSAFPIFSQITITNIARYS